MRAWVIEQTSAVYAFLLPWAWWAFGLSVLIGGPMLLFQRTRAKAGAGLIAASYVIGAAAWFLGATLSFASFGWLGLVVGLLVLGIGVVPVGIVGAWWRLDSGPMALSLLAMVVVVFVFRVVGAVASSSRSVVGDRH